MSRRRRLATVIRVVAGVWASLHCYVGARVTGTLRLGAPWQVVAWGAVLLLALGPFVAFWAGRAEQAQRLAAKRPLEVAGFTAMGLSSLLIVFVLVGDVLHARAWLGPGGFSVGGGGGALAGLGAGVWRARRPAGGRGGQVPIAGPPLGLPGLRIVPRSRPPRGPAPRPGFAGR